MMTPLTRDPLLALARGILWFLMACMVVAAAACLIAAPLMHFYQDQITLELAKEAPRASVSSLLWAATGILACVAGLTLILFRMFQLLKHIVDTVGEGDPFVPENAGRLTQMAWLTLAVQLVTLPIEAIADSIAEAVNDPSEVHTEIHTLDFGFSSNGLLLMLILFILARVFRKGAAMRAELEGTV
jgi:NADH:ubiquinone oxidoreductase subunit 5 (subunit L)/multisubunit Na+/H+ antiporter MnhA subunit